MAVKTPAEDNNNKDNNCSYNYKKNNKSKDELTVRFTQIKDVSSNV